MRTTKNVQQSRTSRQQMSSRCHHRAYWNQDTKAQPSLRLAANPCKSLSRRFSIAEATKTYERRTTKGTFKATSNLQVSISQVHHCPSNQAIRKTKNVQQRGTSRQEATYRTLFRQVFIAEATKTREGRKSSNKGDLLLDNKQST
ncbi:unnamed protein product, partial [Ectocarpus sp. 13 AM-2016]